MPQPSLSPSSIPEPPRLGASPFALDAESEYRAWRTWKLAARPRSVEALWVTVADAARPGEAERAALLDRLRRGNLALYRAAADVDRRRLRAFGRAFGLERLDGNLYADEDGITALSVAPGGRQGEYIPYTDRRLSWHTDGYYNDADHQIRAILMHCARPAERGGESRFMDHELAYILLRDENPEWIEALMQPDALTIPANVEQGVVLRGAVSGPVFSVDAATGALHMRYSARLRNVEWKDDPRVHAAADFLQALWREGHEYMLQVRLAAGEGILCNNVLHARSAFVDPVAGEGRLLYRARYYDRIAGTGFEERFGLRARP